MKTRTLANGRTVSAHRNGGIRKRCGCPRRQWTKCAHPWHANFSCKGACPEHATDRSKGTEHRISLHAYAKKPDTYVMLKGEGETLFAKWRSSVIDAEPGSTPERGDTPTFGAVLDLYVQLHLDPTKRQPRVKAELDRHIATIRETFGGTDITAITKAAVQRWRIELLAGKRGAVAVNRILSRLRHVFAWAIRHDYATTTPFAGRAIDFADERPRQRRVEGDEEARLLAVAPPKLHALIVAALETGMRRGELLGLQWAHITDGMIELPGTMTKNGRGRLIPISQRLSAVLEMRRTAADGKPHGPAAYVFGDECGGQTGDIFQAFDAARKKAGIVGLRFHDLRREAASRWLETPGVNVTDVRDILGHSNIAITNTYLAANKPRLREVMTLVDAAKSGKSRTPLAHDSSATTAPESATTIN